jgi:hypothetical protein
MCKARQSARTSVGFVLSFIVFLISTISIVCAEEENRKHNDARISALIGMLASKNPAPATREGIMNVPKHFDKQAQAVVYLAIQQLLSEGSEAFDLLIQHLDDEEYCYSYNAPAGNFNVNVGTACYQVLIRSIQCYEFEIELITRDQHDLYLKWKSKPDAAKWWADNRDRPLWQIQIEAIDEAIQFMETISRATARSSHPYAEKLTVKEFEASRKKNLHLLEVRRKSIAVTQEYYRPKSVGNHFSTMTLLPWGNDRPIRFSK